MKRIAFERYLQRMKMTLSRDLDVRGVVHLGPVVSVNDDRTDVRELDFLVAMRPEVAPRYLDDLDWLPGRDGLVCSAAFGAGRRDLLFEDGFVVRNNFV